jgi:hypothetical protein
MSEDWKEIIHKGFATGYYISNFGKVRKWDDKTNDWFYPKLTNRITKPGQSGSSQSFRMSFNGTTAGLTTHCAVMRAFKPLDDHPPVNKVDWDKTPESAKEILKKLMIIDHIDDNPFNNHVSNLRWCTPYENNPHNKKRLNSV